MYIIRPEIGKIKKIWYPDLIKYTIPKTKIRKKIILVNKNNK
jgi:hypothetical protein